MMSVSYLTLFKNLVLTGCGPARNARKQASVQFRGSHAKSGTSDACGWRSTVPDCHSTRHTCPSRAVTTPVTKAVSGSMAPKASKKFRTGMPTQRLS